ncbi:MAG: murein biosynthesis integral membrane protein MurJ [Acidobacteriota bacterium]|jgi:putative peptidoglycan lipid II flippase
MSRGAKSALAAGKVSVAVFLSRILGLVRDQFFANLFGAGLYNDAWLVAFRIPNLLRDLFAEGALSAAFLPTFTEIYRKQGRAQAWHLANLVLSGVLILLGIVTIILFLFSTLFVHGLAAGFADVPGKVHITSTLIRILSPFLMLVALASVAMGILNAFNHYFLPALAPALFNVALILTAIFGVPLFRSAGILPVYAMGFGALIGGVLQFAVQIPIMRKEGFHFRFRINWRDSGIRRMRKLLGPALIGVSAVQVNILVNTQLASFLQDNGPVSWLSYAFRIMYLPIGLFGVAVGVVNLREVSVFAAQEQYHELKETVADSLKLISFMAIPSTIGLVVLAAPIVRVLFQRGDFTAQDTYFTAWALVAYAVGLTAYSCNKVYVPTFYALDDTRTPVRISIFTVCTNIAINVALIWALPVDYKFVGLALGTSLSVTLSNSLLSWRLRQRLGDLHEFGIRRMVARDFVAAALMGGLVWWLDGTLAHVWPLRGIVGQVSQLGVLIGVGGAVYLVLCRLFGVHEVGYLIQALRRQR